MDKSKIIHAVDLVVFLLIILCTVMVFRHKTISKKMDSTFLPEERNRGYYEILNNGKMCYISDELMENGSKNLLANCLKSGERAEGYSIEVNPDGTFSVSGSYNGESNRYEYPMSGSDGLKLPAGDYVFSDGGASSEVILLRVVGVQHMMGGEANYISVATLPDQGSFHWDGSNDTELIVDLVIRPGFEATELKFEPMLQSVHEGEETVEYQPCLTPNYDWEKEMNVKSSIFYKYDIFKGTLDGKTVTKDDWKILTNRIRYQMQENRAVIDFQDGTGIEINKQSFPIAIYGKLNASKMITDGHEIKLTDYIEVMDSIKSDFGDISSTELKSIRDFYTYLKALYHENYTVLISVKDEGVNALSNGSYSLLQKLGVISDLMEKENNDIRRKKNYQNSFLCVLRQGKADAEKLGEQKLISEGELPDGVSYSIESSGQKAGESKASVLINGNEFAMNMRGMNIVVYDEKKHEVVDSVCFDTYSGLFCHRQAG